MAPATAQAQRVVPARDGSYTLTQSGLRRSVESRSRRSRTRWGRKVGFQEIFNHGRAVHARARRHAGARTRSPASAGRTTTRTRRTGARRASRAAPTPTRRDGRRYKVLITSWHHEPRPVVRADHAAQHDGQQAGAPVPARAARRAARGRRPGSPCSPTPAASRGSATTSTWRLPTTCGCSTSTTSSRSSRLAAASCPAATTTSSRSPGATPPTQPGLAFSSVSLDRTGGGPRS